MMPATDQDTIRAIIDARSAAVSNGDVETSMADVDESVVMFDVVDPCAMSVRRRPLRAPEAGVRPSSSLQGSRLAMSKYSSAAMWRSATSSAM